MIPPIPPFRGPGPERGEAELLPRYEDITQDGRLVLTAMMPGLGQAVWRALLGANPALESFRMQGVLPILRRLVLVSEAAPLTVHAPIHYEGTWRLARETDGDRIFLNMWLDAEAPEGTTFGPPPPVDAPRRRVGRVFAEHVVTRPFAPPAERKVTRLEVPGLLEVPEDLHPFEAAEALVEGAALEDGGEVAFGVMHTDSNQHVNSLVYPRLFEEAVLKKTGSKARVATRVELRFRKPFFAGDRARIRLRVGEGGEGTESVGAFYGDADKPHCTIAMTLA